MRQMDKSVSGYNTTHIALSVGKNSNCYSINSIYRQNTENGELTVTNTVVKNNHCTTKEINVKYREGVKFREEFITGTYKECFEFISNILNIENATECDTYLYEYFGKEHYKIEYDSVKDFKQDKVLYKGKSINDVIQWAKNNGWKTQYNNDNPYGSWIKEQA